MNRISFVNYVTSNFRVGKKPITIIEEINKNISEFGELVLPSVDGGEISIKPQWLINFKYEEVINEMYKEFQEEENEI